MIVRFRPRLFRKLICAVALVVAAGVTTAFGVAPANAAPGAPGLVAAPGPVTVQSGSGTVSDPWVPMLNARTTCQSTTLWGNYSGGSHKDPIASLPYWTWLGVRYITSDGRSGMVLWHGGGTWGFMLRSCFVIT